MTDAEYLAMTFHIYYEELTPRFAQRESVPWLQVPEKDKLLMIAVAEKLLNGHVQIIKQEVADEDKCLCLPTGKPYKYCPVHSQEEN